MRIAERVPHETNKLANDTAVRAAEPVLSYAKAYSQGCSELQSQGPPECADFQKRYHLSAREAALACLQLQEPDLTIAFASSSLREQKQHRFIFQALLSDYFPACANTCHIGA